MQLGIIASFDAPTAANLAVFLIAYHLLAWAFELGGLYTFAAGAVCALLAVTLGEIAALAVKAWRERRATEEANKSSFE